MAVIKCAIPLNVQFEVTYRCNNRCVFCYNSKNVSKCDELTTQEAIRIVKSLASCGVLSVNFNGGEPLIRDDYFEIVRVADNCRLDIHMNTNANMIDRFNAKMISKYFPAVCTTILSSDAKVHDELSGRQNALADAERGIKYLQEQFVYVAVNIMLSGKNIDSIELTYDFLRLMKIRSVLLTRYIPCENNIPGLEITDQQFLEAVSKLYAYNDKYQCFDRIAFPQPFKPCNATRGLKDKIAASNIACNVGLCTVSISPNGDVTPCNLVKIPVLGNLKTEGFSEIWKNFNGEEMFCKEHLGTNCIECNYLSRCGGGCKGYNDALCRRE